MLSTRYTSVFTWRKRTLCDFQGMGPPPCSSTDSKIQRVLLLMCRVVCGARRRSPCSWKYFSTGSTSMITSPFAFSSVMVPSKLTMVLATSAPALLSTTSSSSSRDSTFRAPMDNSDFVSGSWTVTTWELRSMYLSPRSRLP